MAKQKPYFDAGETKRLMLRNIEALLDEKEMPDSLEQKCIALMSFYRNPPGAGMQYSWNHLWVMCSEFNQLYTRMQKLLWEDIEAAKQPKTRMKRRVEAAEITITIWIKGHHFDPETGMVEVVPIPEPKPSTEADKERIRASVRATWKRGSRDS